MNRQTRPRLTIRMCAKRTHVSIFSKSVVQILLWQILLVAIYIAALEEIPSIIILPGPGLSDWSQIMRFMIIKTLLLIYPLGTIVGDVWLGRYKTIVISLLIIVVSLLSSSVGGVLLFVRDGVATDNVPLHTASIVLHILSAPIFIIGFSIFNSNIIQFGLDQLIHKPSESLGEFTHWLVWAVKVGTVLMQVIYVIRDCADQYVAYVFRIIVQSLPICCLALLLILLLVSSCTSRQLNHDGVLYNPYKMIYNVFRFARKNKYPLNPVSAFNNTKLSRLDNAKERYGGPFRNTEVEDVKYFQRVLIVLCALGSVFVLNLPLNAYFSRFTQHTGFSIYIHSLNKTCSRLNPEFFSHAFGVFLLPLYIWIMYSFLQNRRPKILHRLVLLVLLYILAGVSMLVIDTAGHLSLYTHQEHQPLCMFLSDTNRTTLNMHWAVNIFPGVINGVYYLLLATSLEFIAAQSPHAMRGVLMGAFYFMLGIFRVLSVLLLIPFRVASIWGEGDLGNNPPVISCGFGYYTVCISIAVVGFVALLLTVKWYQYRRRDEPFTPDQQTNTPRRQDYQQLN